MTQVESNLRTALQLPVGKIEPKRMTDVMRAVRSEAGVCLLTFGLVQPSAACMDLVAELAESSQVFILGASTDGDFFALVDADLNERLAQLAAARCITLTRPYDRVMVAYGSMTADADLPSFKEAVVSSLRRRRSSLEAVSFAA